MITLINPPGLKSFSGLQMHTPNPPQGHAYIAGALKAAGLRYTVVDATGDALDQISVYPARTDFMLQGLGFDEIIGRIPADTHLIGLTCMFSTLWPLTRDLAQHIRKSFPDALIVLGGEHGTAVSELVLRTSAINLVVLGEGEETMVRVAERVASGQSWRDVPGIAYFDEDQFRSNGLSARIRVVDDVALPDWDSFPIENYISRHQINGINLGRAMPLLSTRGCPYQCTFCSSPGMWTTRYVPRDPIKVVDEIALYAERHKITNIDFQDLTAVVKRQWVIEFCHELIKRDLNVTWQMPSGTRSEVFDEEVADLLYQSGCRALAFAPESGAPEILEKVKKQVDLDHMLTAMRVALRRGFKLSCFLVIGFPDDTPTTLRKTLHLIRRMAVLGVYDVSVSKFVPYPGSQLFKQLQQSGQLEMDDVFFLSPMDFYSRKAPSYSPHISTQRLFFSMLWFYTNFYVVSFACRPLRTARILIKAVATGTEETRFAKWLNDFLFVRRRWRKTAARRIEQGARQPFVRRSVPVIIMAMTLADYDHVWKLKPGLRAVYSDFYDRIAARVVAGPVLEIGGGIGNLRQRFERVVSTDIQFAPWLDCIVDAHRLPFGAQTLANIVMVDVLHHLEFPIQFFREAQRTRPRRTDHHGRTGDHLGQLAILSLAASRARANARRPLFGRSARPNPRPLCFESGDPDADRDPRPPAFPQQPPRNCG